MGVITMNFQALEEYDINLFEYGFNTDYRGHGSGSFSMNIPKLMPLIARGAPATSNVVFNNNIFVNADDCKPAASASVAIQNYLTVRRFRNTDFSTKQDSNGCIPSGSKFICCIMDKNIKDIFLTDNV
jgi:hypothetical protein